MPSTWTDVRARIEALMAEGAFRRYAHASGQVLCDDWRHGIDLAQLACSCGAVV